MEAERDLMCLKLTQPCSFINLQLLVMVQLIDMPFLATTYDLRITLTHENSFADKQQIIPTTEQSPIKITIWFTQQ